MKNLPLIFRHISLILLFLTAYDVDAQVNVNIRVLPPYQSRITEYASRPDLMLLTLTNTSITPRRVQLSASISGDNGVGAWVRPGYRSPQAIELAPGQVLNLNGTDIAFLFDHNQIQYTGISQADFTRGVGLLEGTYQLCVKALDYDTHNPLSPEEPIGCTQLVISSVEPPTIISPFNEQELRADGPQAFPITWSTPPGASPMTQYKVKLVEMIVPRNPNDAIQSSTTPPFFEETVNMNMLLYGPQYPQLTPGRQYALMVQAIDPFGTISFRNQGMSEVVLFTYGATQAEPAGPIVVYQGDTLRKDTTRIRGRLRYRFAGDAEGRTFPVAHERVYLKKVFARQEMDDDGVARFVPLSSRESLAIDDQSAMLDGVAVETDEDGNFTLTCLMSALDSAGVVPDGKRDWFTGGQATKSRVSGFGNFGQVPDNLVLMYQLVTTNPHYKPYGEYLAITPGGTRDLADVVVAANSYTLSVNVQEVFNQLRGDYVAGAKIRIYRNMADKNDKRLGIPKYEGDLLDDGRLNNTTAADKVLIAERTTPSPSGSADPETFRVNFERLFRNLDAEPYRYRVSLENGNMVLMETSLDQLQMALGVSPLGDRIAKQGKSDGKETAKAIDTKGLVALFGTGAAKPAPSNPKGESPQAQTSDGKAEARVANATPKPSTNRSGWLSYRYNDEPDTARLTLDKNLVTPPRTKLTGKLQYAYKTDRSMPATPYANMPVKLVVFYLLDENGSSTPDKRGREVTGKTLKGVTAKVGAVTSSSFYSTAAMRYANQDLVGPQASASGSISGAKLFVPGISAEVGATAIGSSSVVQGVLNGELQAGSEDGYERLAGNNIEVGGKTIQDNMQVLQTVYTDAEGRFTFDFPNGEFTGAELDGSVATPVPDQTGLRAYGKVKRVYRVVPDVRYYCAPDENIVVQPWEDADCGTLTSFVQTVNIDVHVEKIGRLDKPDILGGFANVPVNLYKPAYSSTRKYWPVMQGIDINREVNPFNSGGNMMLAGTVTMATGSMANTGNSNTLNNAFQTARFTPNYNATYSGASLVAFSGRQTDGKPAAANVLAMRPQYGVLQSAAPLVSSPVVTNFQTYVLYRQGASDENGNIRFENVPKSLPITQDMIMLEADGRDRLTAAAFETAYLDFPATKNIPTRREVENPGIDMDNKGIIRTDASSFVFNSEFDPSVNQSVYFRVLAKPTEVRGRITDDFTTLGIKGVKLHVSISFGVNNNAYYLSEFTETNADGYYDFSSKIKDFLINAGNDGVEKTGETGYLYVRLISAPGYEVPAEPYGVQIAPGVTGKREDYTTALKPLGRNAFGYVVDAENPAKGVTARVKIKDRGRWVDTYAYTGKKDEPAKEKNYMEYNGYYASSFDAVVQSNIQLATQSGTQSVSRPLGNAGMLVTTLVNNKPQTTFKASSAASVSPIVQAAMARSEESGSNIQVMGAIRDMQVGPSVGVTALNRVTDLQRFDIDLPARPDSIMILPYDPAYIGVTVAVNPDGPDAYLGDFKLQRREHRVEILVKTTTGGVVTNANVEIEGAGDDNFRKTNSMGLASFTYVNNSIDNFTVRVSNGAQPRSQTGKARETAPDTAPAKGAQPQQTGGLRLPDGNVGNANGTGNGQLNIVSPTRQNVLFVPRTQNFVSNDDNVVHRVTVVVQPATVMTGRVVFAADSSPVRGAVVYIDQGRGSESDMRAETRSDGTYELIVPAPAASGLFPSGNSQLPQAITATYSAPGRTYIGQTVSLAKRGKVPQSAPTSVDFAIREAGDIDVSKLYGFPARLNDLRPTSGGYLVSGELYDLEDNPNFALRSASGPKVLAFENLKVGASTITNDDGVPLAVPTEDHIQFEQKQLRIRVFNVFNGQLAEQGNGKLKMTKGQTDTTGVLNGQVRIVDNSFNFPTSYMTISNSDFYVGNYGNANTAQKLTIPVFRTGEPYPLTKFSITAGNGSPIRFKYLGFDGLTETAGERESFVMGDSVNLFMNLTARIQGGITLDLKAGKAVIRHDRMDPVVTDNEVRFKLEEWEVHSTSWTLSNTSGGIVLNNNTLYTGKADIKLSKISIIPGELIFHNATGSEAANLRKNLTVGGKANIKLHVNPRADIAFVYDPDVGRIPGQGHFKFTLRSDDGKAAHLKGLPGMTNPNDRLEIQYMSLLSNNEEVFGFSTDAEGITFQNQLSFKPQSIYSAFDRLVISGAASLHIPNVPDNLSATISYYPEGNGTNRLVVSPLEFSFTGSGGTTFTTLKQENAQLFHEKGIGIAGTIKLPGQSTTLKANLVSMVTGGLNGAADEARRQTEIVLGAYQEEAGRMAANLVDEVANDPALAEARRTLEEAMGGANDTYNQLLQMGGTAEQAMQELAGKWRLIGEGMDIVNNGIDNNPIGAAMQINGIIKGFSGIDIADKAKQTAKMVAMEALKGIQDEIPVQKIADGAAGGNGGFSDMKFDFDFANGRVFGSLSMPKLEAGAVTLTKLGIEMLFDPKGWYFYTGANINVRGVPLIFPLGVGMCVGSYPEISPALEARITEVSYVKRLPNTYKANGIQGFFLTGRKDIIEEVKFEVPGIGIEVGAMAGLDARIYANFGGASQELGIGAMAFGRAYARMSPVSQLLMGCGISGEVKAELGVKTTFTNSPAGVTFNARACGSLNMKAEVTCLLVAKKSFDIGFLALLDLCVGADCTKTVNFNARLSDESCSESNDFDY
ncbi:hypothetical protein FAZ19_00755 [Sphingobacterium alkalisoli]|uniref:TANFOR domain-containing protein n=1 Tax=Sphingobacterium alkalisoli TaxID=1874115 RepID=A0A4U0H801_9SPHI|nr:hypothetical protein [Sphingobacterium alkalisoli]TJY67826.1 hypothetical protein FAZ19_00755 [Sphingobacterium alkalisoli]